MRLRNGLVLAAVLATAFVATGCGKLTMRTWVQTVEGASSGSIVIPQVADIPVTEVDGGFLTTIVVDTINWSPIQGTLTVNDLRIAANAGGETGLGTMCVWGDPAVSSGGTVVLDILGGASSATVALSMLATTTISEEAQLPPVALSQTSTLPLGDGLDVEALINAALSGEVDGLFATSAAFSGETTILGLGATFNLNLELTNMSKPPKFDPAALDFCAPFFNQQGSDMYYGANSKGSYLRAQGIDNPNAPLVIPLSDLGIVPGNKVKLTRVGTFSEIAELKDGNQSKLTGVFSSSTTLLAKNNRYRVQGAINAGSDVNTAPYWECLIFPLCWQVPTDIAQDFRIDPTVTVTVPANAQYLMVAALPDSYIWADNLGFGFGVTIEVVP